MNEKAHRSAAISRRDLLTRIKSLRPNTRRTVLVAIDGRGASGKSELARFIEESVPTVTVVHTDDFAIDPGWDWARIQKQVLDPILKDEPGRFQRFDWNSKRLAEWHEVPAGGIVVVEGVSSTRQELGDPWDLKIWVDCAKVERLRRALERDGESMMPTWLNVWEPEEDRFVREQSPRRRADVIVDGTADEE